MAAVGESCALVWGDGAWGETTDRAWISVIGGLGGRVKIDGAYTCKFL